jgi:peroxiredoxin family protein
LGKGILAKTFGFLMGGANNVPLSRFNFLGASPKLMTFLMCKRNVGTLKDLVDAAITLNVNLFACEMSMNILGITKDDFIPEIKEVLGVVNFLQYSEGGDRIFI